MPHFSLGPLTYPECCSRPSHRANSSSSRLQTGVTFTESSVFLHFYLFYYLFTYLWLLWVFAASHGLFPVEPSKGYSCHVRASHCGGFSRCGARVLGSQASVVAALGLSRCGTGTLVASRCCGIFPDRGSNPRPLHW